MSVWSRLFMLLHTPLKIHNKKTERVVKGIGNRKGNYSGLLYNYGKLCHFILHRRSTYVTKILHYTRLPNWFLSILVMKSIAWKADVWNRRGVSISVPKVCRFLFLGYYLIGCWKSNKSVGKKYLDTWEKFFTRCLKCCHRGGLSAEDVLGWSSCSEGQNSLPPLFPRKRKTKKKSKKYVWNNYTAATI